MRGRFAPSPTGDLHLGAARTALCAWLSARAQGGAFVLRIEDLDGPRVVPGADQRILADLAALGLDWDEGPDKGGGSADLYRQSRRGGRYGEVLDELSRRGLVYPCYCSRAEVARAASAPHAGEEGPRYPGTCRELTAAGRAERERAGRRAALRLRVEPGAVEFVDAVHGLARFEPSAETGDFVVRRSDGLFAYQLAVVIDDVDQGITEVVRADDLLSSTARQLLVYRALGAPPPRFAHVPLVLGPDGQRLAKRHGAVSVRALIEGGRSAAAVVGLLAATLGEAAPGASGQPLTAAELVSGFAVERVARAPFRLDPAPLAHR